MANRLTEARVNAGLTIRQLAKLCDAQPSQIIRIESDTAHLRRAGAALIYSAACALGVPLGWLLEMDSKADPGGERTDRSTPNQAVRLHNAGCSLTQMAQILGISAAAVCDALREAGVPAGEIKILRHKAMMEAWEAGCHDAEIARRSGMAVSAVAKWRKATDRTERSAPNRTPGNHSWDRDEAKRLYDAGLPDAKIAAGVGVHKNTIVNWRRDNGLPSKSIRGRRSDAPETELEVKFTRLYEQGHSDPEIAEATAVPVKTVRTWRQKQGLPGTSRRPLDGDEAYRLYQEGASDLAIAEAIGCTPGRVLRWRRSRNLPAHKRSNFDGAAVWQLWEQGATDQEIADQLGLTIRQVWSWRTRNKKQQNKHDD